MVGNLLLLTRIQNINIRDTFSMVNLDAVLLNTFEEYSVIAKNKGVYLDIKKLEYLQIKAEPTLIKILLSNLLDNAIKFTPKGKKITISLVKSVLIIDDEGIGIPEDKLQMVFDEFYRVNSPEKEHVKGYGLGLSMVKKITQIHKIKIKILSKTGLGTKVVLNFKNQS